MARTFTPGKRVPGRANPRLQADRERQRSQFIPPAPPVIASSHRCAATSRRLKRPLFCRLMKREAKDVLFWVLRGSLAVLALGLLVYSYGWARAIISFLTEGTAAYYRLDPSEVPGSQSIGIGFWVALVGIVSALVTIISVIVTKAIEYKREARAAQLDRVALEKAQIDLERAKIELAALKNSGAKAAEPTAAGRPRGSA